MVKPFEVNVSSKYGAPMGRRSDYLEGKVHLQHVPFVDQCYDPGGAYWGMPANLYCAWNDKGTAYVRADNRSEAKMQLKNCTFYR